jgi:hypothetical protein
MTALECMQNPEVVMRRDFGAEIRPLPDFRTKVVVLHLRWRPLLGGVQHAKDCHRTGFFGVDHHVV